MFLCQSGEISWYFVVGFGAGIWFLLICRAFAVWDAGIKKPAVLQRAFCQAVIVIGSPV